ncbi:MAG TPA: hypothetical protein VKJ65_10665 [Phycisphaerae bacterium]|nr:hypothetical protein [Phycisphaerae bacterium]
MLLSSDGAVNNGQNAVDARKPDGQTHRPLVLAEKFQEKRDEPVNPVLTRTAGILPASKTSAIRPGENNLIVDADTFFRCGPALACLLLWQRHTKGCGWDIEPEVHFHRTKSQIQSMKNIQAAILATVMGLVTPAHAQLFDITFSDVAEGGSTVGSGWVSVDLISTGVYEATDGSFTINSGGALDAGTYSLLLNPNPPDESTSPSGYFYFDNQVSPDTDPFLDNGGLLFGSGSTEINLFSNAGDVPEYQLYENTGANVLGDATIDTISAAPEPSTVMLGLPCIAALRLLGRNRTAYRASRRW